MSGWRATCAVVCFGLVACADHSGSPSTTWQSSVGLKRPQVSEQNLTPGLVRAIRVTVVNCDHDGTLAWLTPEERVELSALYDVQGVAPLWVDSSGRPD